MKGFPAGKVPAQILVGNAEYGAVRHTARRTVIMILPWASSSVLMESSVKPRKNHPVHPDDGSAGTRNDAALLKMLRQGKQPFLPDHLVFHVAIVSFPLFSSQSHWRGYAQQAIVVADTFYRLNLFPFCGWSSEK